MREETFISIIMPTYNRAYVIARAIDSVLKQTYSSFEFIIVDDGSDDETQEIVESYRDSRIQYVRLEENRGANYARNIGLNHCSGEWIAFIDSDNVWEPDKLAIQVEKIQELSDEAGIIFGKAYIHHIDSRYSYIMPQKEDVANYTKTMLEKNLIDTNTVLIKKQCFDKVGCFDEAFPRLQDWEMFYRIITFGHYEVVFVDKLLSHSYVQTNSISMISKYYVEARLLFFEKFVDIFVEHYEVEYVVNEIMGYEGTGMPYGERYKRIKDILKAYPLLIDKVEQLVIDRQFQKNDRLTLRTGILIDWLDIKLQGKSLGVYFTRHHYRKIIAYGYGELGKRFVEECKSYDIEISAIMDKDAKQGRGEDIPIIHPEWDCERCDVIVVSVVEYYDEIKNYLEKIGRQEAVVSLKDLVRECVG